MVGDQKYLQEKGSVDPNWEPKKSTKNRGTVTGTNCSFSHFETYPNYVPSWQPISPDSCQPWGPHETMCATCQHPRFKEAWPIDGARCFNCSFGASGFQRPKSLDDPPGDRNFHEQLGYSNDEWLIALVIYDWVSGMIIQAGKSFGCLVGYSNYFLLQCTASYINSHNINNIIPCTCQFTCLSSTFSTWKLALHSLHSALDNTVDVSTKMGSIHPVQKTTSQNATWSMLRCFIHVWSMPGAWKIKSKIPQAQF